MSVTLERALDAFYTYSEKLSDAVRQLSLAGVAVIWLVRVGGENAGGISWRAFLVWPLGVFVVALALDLGQYVYYSAYWQIFHRSKEIVAQKLKAQGESIPDTFPVHPRLNRIGNWFFWGKAVATVLGYCLLISFIFTQLLFVNRISCC